MDKNKKKIIVIGAGPAGMMAAIIAANNKNNEVILIDKNEKIGKKLFITGKGRANISNNCNKDIFFNNIIHNSKFLYSSYNNFSNFDLIDFFENNGLKLKVERGNRVFPSTDKSSDVIKFFYEMLVKSNVNIMLKTEVLDINFDVINDNKIINNIKIKNLNTNKISTMLLDKLIIATGGNSYKSTGSNGSGYIFAKKCGIKVNDIYGGLTELKVIEKNECAKLNGLILKNVNIKCILQNNKKIYFEDFGDMEFRDSMLSGPLILSLSSYLPINPNCKIYIDLKPALDNIQLSNRIDREIEELKKINKKVYIKQILRKLLPNIFINIFYDRLLKKINDIQRCFECINDKINNNVNLVNNNNLLMQNDYKIQIIELLKNFEYNIIDRDNIDNAIVTIGGIDVKEINPKTMESKKVSGLYFVGEVLDVDALTGGFNITIACSTGYTAGINI